MADTEIGITITAQDRASATLATLQQAVRQFQASLQSLNTGALGAGMASDLNKVGTAAKGATSELGNMARAGTGLGQMSGALNAVGVNAFGMRSAISGLTGVIGPMGIALAGGAAVTLTLGNAMRQAVAQAAEFQTSTTTLVTGAGEVASNLNDIQQGMLAMAGQVGESANQLAQGAYMIESAGFHGAAALQILQASAEGAKVGLADQATVANAVTTILNDYKLSAGDAAGTTGQLMSAVSLGKVHLQDLAGALSTVLPVAAELNIPFQDIGAAMATMTAHGVEATTAAQGLRYGLMEMERGTGPVKTAVADLGLDWRQLQEQLSQGNMTGVLQQIAGQYDALAASGRKAQADADLSNIFGGVRGSALITLIQNMQEYNTDLNRIGDTTQGVAALQERWRTVQGTLNQQVDELKGRMGAFGITIGSDVVPGLTDLVSKLNDAGSGFDTLGRKVQDFLSIKGPGGVSVGDFFHAMATGVAGLVSGPLTALGISKLGASTAPTGTTTAYPDESARGLAMQNDTLIRGYAEGFANYCLAWVEKEAKFNAPNFGALSPTAANAYDIYANKGAATNTPKAGDLVFFGGVANGAGHVGIMTGAGRFTSALPESGQGAGGTAEIVDMSIKKFLSENPGATLKGFISSAALGATPPAYAYPFGQPSGATGPSADQAYSQGVAGVQALQGKYAGMSLKDLQAQYDALNQKIHQEEGGIQAVQEAQKQLKDSGGTVSAADKQSLEQHQADLKKDQDELQAMSEAMAKVRQASAGATDPLKAQAQQQADALAAANLRLKESADTLRGIYQPAIDSAKATLAELVKTQQQDAIAVTLDNEAIRHQQGVIAQMNTTMHSYQDAVKGAEDAVRSATLAAKEDQQTLSDLQKTVSDLTSALSAAKSAESAFASAATAPYQAQIDALQEQIDAKKVQYLQKGMDTSSIDKMGDVKKLQDQITLLQTQSEMAGLQAKQAEASGNVFDFGTQIDQLNAAGQGGLAGFLSSLNGQNQASISMTQITQGIQQAIAAQKSLSGALPGANAAVIAQQQRVKADQQAVDAANNSLQNAQKAQQEYADKINAANIALDNQKAKLASDTDTLDKAKAAVQQQRDLIDGWNRAWKTAQDQIVNGTNPALDLLKSNLKVTTDTLHLIEQQIKQGNLPSAQDLTEYLNAQTTPATITLGSALTSDLGKALDTAAHLTDTATQSMQGWQKALDDARKDATNGVALTVDINTIVNGPSGGSSGGFDYMGQPYSGPRTPYGLPNPGSKHFMDPVTGQPSDMPAGGNGPNIPIADTGGIFKGPGVVRLGNISEAVFAPMSGGGFGGTGRGSIVVNVTLNNSEVGVTDFTDRIVAAVTQAQRQGRLIGVGS